MASHQPTQPLVLSKSLDSLPLTPFRLISP